VKFKTLTTFLNIRIQIFLFFYLFIYGSLALQGQSALLNFDPSTPDAKPYGDPSKDLPNQLPPDRDDEDNDDLRALRSELENKKKELSQSRKTNHSLTDSLGLLQKKI
jgi:hypothetical protein